MATTNRQTLEQIWATAQRQAQLDNLEGLEGMKQTLEEAEDWQYQHTWKEHPGRCIGEKDSIKMLRYFLLKHIEYPELTTYDLPDTGLLTLAQCQADRDAGFLASPGDPLGSDFGDFRYIGGPWPAGPEMFRQACILAHYPNETGGFSTLVELISGDRPGLSKRLAWLSIARRVDQNNILEGDDSFRERAARLSQLIISADIAPYNDEDPLLNPFCATWGYELILQNAADPTEANRIYLADDLYLPFGSTGRPDDDYE